MVKKQSKSDARVPTMLAICEVTINILHESGDVTVYQVMILNKIGIIK